MAAPKFPAGIDLAKSSAFGLRFENLGSAPGTPVTGQAYVDTAGSANLLKVYNGSVWMTLGRLDQINAPTAAVSMGSQQITSLADPSGAQHAATQNYVVTRKVTDLTAPTAAFSMNSQKITNLATPTTAGDAAEYSWVQAQVEAARQGLNVKMPVKVVATSNVTIASPGATIDGVTMAANDRFLVTNQTTGAENGIYNWTAAATPATRAVDADVFGEIQDGAFVFVMQGTDAGKQYLQTATLTSFSGQTWTIFGGGTTYTFSTGLTNTAGTITANMSILVGKYATDFGNGSLQSFTITHNLGTLDITAQVREGSTGAFVYPDVTPATTNTCTVAGFTGVPTTNQYRIVVHG